MATLTFTKGALSVQFARGRIFPTNVNEHVNQLLELAEDLTPQVTELGPTVHEYEVELLSVDGITEGQFRAFMEDPSVRWALNTITVLPESGSTFTGRYWGPSPYHRTEYAPGLFRLQFLLRQEN